MLDCQNLFILASITCNRSMSSWSLFTAVRIPSPIPICKNEITDSQSNITEFIEGDNFCYVSID